MLDEFQELIAPETKKLDALLDFHIPYTVLQSTEECARCQSDVRLQSIVWGGAYPYCSLECRDIDQEDVNAWHESIAASAEWTN
jgi:endogenous inhibitor of DNA gyrase (YacG/DUF329 family)